MAKGGILADEVGLGKTMMTIALCNTNKVKNTLILTPKSIIDQWSKEIKKFAPHFKVSVSFEDDYSINEDENVIHIVLASHSRLNSATIKKVENSVYAKTMWDRIIIDEAHVIKNKRSKIHKACMALQSPIKWALTATPVMNKMTDFVYILDFIGISQEMCQNHKDEISDMYILRRTKEDVSDEVTTELPPLHINVEDVEFMFPEEQQLYTDVYNEIREIMKTMQKYENKNTIQALELLLRIRQICTYPQCYYDGMAKKAGNDPETWIHGCTKVEHIVSKIGKQPVEDKSLIFCHFISEMDAYVSRLNQEDIKALRLDGSMSVEDRARIVKKFETSNYKVLVIQIQTGAVGFNLQCANHVYITSPLWSPALQHQVIGRAHRNGQTKPVHVHIYAIKGHRESDVYIEQYMLRLQQRKREMMSDVLNDERIKDQGFELMKDKQIRNDISFNDVYKMFNKPFN